jgi:very-short-patch-repair endonuclease
MQIHNVVRRSTLLRNGVASAAIQRNVRVGTWHRVRSGIYVVGPGDANRPWLQALATEIVWAGPGALLSHRAAAFLHRFDDTAAIWRDLTVPDESTRRGAHVHRCGVELPRVLVDGLPVVTVDACLIQLGRHLDADGVEVALESALRAKATTIESLALKLESRLGRMERAGTLRLVLGRRPLGAPATGSFLETQFVQAERQAGLPHLQRQVEIFDRLGVSLGRVDFADREQKLAVECDGGEHHGPEHRSADHRRQNAMEMAGWRFARFTFHQIMRERPYVQSVIRDWRRMVA